VLLFGTLAIVCHAVAGQNEQRLLQSAYSRRSPRALHRWGHGRAGGPSRHDGGARSTDDIDALLLIRFGDVAVEAPILSHAPIADVATST
jgi:hypothetical protein